MKRPFLVILTGPTASGKTSLSLRVARDLQAEIINADSVQVYRDFRIGSGMPSNEERQLAPHHLFEVREGNEDWNAGIFREQAETVIAEIGERGNIPLVVGGTGLYVRALLHGLIEVEVHEKSKTELQEIQNRLKAAGSSPEDIQFELYRLLQTQDEETARRIHPHDTQRTQRALLLSMSQNDSLHRLQISHAGEAAKYNALVICVAVERNELYRKIDHRVDAMFAAGLLEEVRTLLEKFGEEIKPLQSIGYKQAVDFLRGRIDEREFLEEMKKHTRRFAKRQETWWKHQPSKLGWMVNETPLRGYEQLLQAIREGMTRNAALPPGSSGQQREIEFRWFSHSEGNREGEGE